MKVYGEEQVRGMHGVAGQPGKVLGEAERQRQVKGVVEAQPARDVVGVQRERTDVEVQQAKAPAEVPDLISEERAGTLLSVRGTVAGWEMAVGEARPPAAV